MEWLDLAAMVHSAVVDNLGESATLDAVPVRLVTLNPQSAIDVGETEYHGQVRRFGLVQLGAPPFARGSVVEMRGGRCFEVTAVVDDGEGMTELVARERDPNAVSLLEAQRLAERAVIAGTGNPPPTTDPAELLDYLQTEGVSDALPPAAGFGGLLAQRRWLQVHLVGAA